MVYKNLGLSFGILASTALCNNNNVTLFGQAKSDDHQGFKQTYGIIP